MTRTSNCCDYPASGEIDVDNIGMCGDCKEFAVFEHPVSETLRITERHGKAMYRNGLEHAIRMFEIDGENVLPQLKEKLVELNKELVELEKK